MEFREDLRYEYPLTAGSIVFDVGAYQGTFTREIAARYDCYVYAFEPVRQFAETVGRLATDRIQVLPYGLGPRSRRTLINVRGDESGFHLDAPTKVPALVRAITVVLVELAVQRIDLFKINIEGDEYALLDHMLDTGLLSRVEHLQVQFHKYGAGPLGPEIRRAKIRDRLAATHDEKWCFPFCWESWSKRPVAGAATDVGVHR